MTIAGDPVDITDTADTAALTLREMLSGWFGTP